MTTLLLLVPDRCIPLVGAAGLPHSPAGARATAWVGRRQRVLVLLAAAIGIAVRVTSSDGPLTAVGGLLRGGCAQRVHADRHRRGRGGRDRGDPGLPAGRDSPPAAPTPRGCAAALRSWCSCSWPRWRWPCWPPTSACCGSRSRPPRSSPRSWSASAAPAAPVEAAWKYVVICSAGIALALLGTFLLNYAAQHTTATPAGLDWAGLTAAAPRPGPRGDPDRGRCCWSSGSAPRPAWRRCTPGCPTPTARPRRRCPR